MHYYWHHIGDFRAGTHNMTREERWIYRDMLDVYYDTEKPLPDDLKAICTAIGARSEREREIVAEILLLKFRLTEQGYMHERCEKEIAEYHKRADTARENGRAGGRPKGSTKKPSGFPSGSNPVASGNPAETQSKANQEPITRNQKPETKRAEARGTRLPEDWHPSEEETAFCKAERPDLRPSEVAQRFYDYWIAIPGAKGRKLDWTATWRQWVRNERRAPISQSAQSDKFRVADLDHSSSRAAMEASMRQHGIVVPEGDDEIKF